MRGDRHPLALQFVFLGKLLGQLLEQRFANQGLNRTQAIVLTALRRRPGLQTLELCAPAGVEPANVTRTLQSLERLGLLERRPHPTDGRASQFFLTDAGESLARRLSEEIHALSADLLQALSPEELPVLEKALAGLRSAVSLRLSASGGQQPAVGPHAWATDPSGAAAGVATESARETAARARALKADRGDLRASL